MFSMLSFAFRHHPRQQRHLICAARGVFWNQQNLYLIPPIAVAWLLQYSGSRVEHRDGFSSHKWLAMRFKMVNLVWIKIFC